MNCFQNSGMQSFVERAACLGLYVVARWNGPLALRPLRLVISGAYPVNLNLMLSERTNQEAGPALGWFLDQFLSGCSSFSDFPSDYLLTQWKCDDTLLDFFADECIYVLLEEFSTLWKGCCFCMQSWSNVSAFLVGSTFLEFVVDSVGWLRPGTICRRTFL